MYTISAYKYERFESLLVPIGNRSKPVQFSRFDVSRFGIVKYHKCGIKGLTLLAEVGGEKYAIVLSKQNKFVKNQLEIIKNDIPSPKSGGDSGYSESWK